MQRGVRRAFWNFISGGVGCNRGLPLQRGRGAQRDQVGYGPGGKVWSEGVPVLRVQPFGRRLLYHSPGHQKLLLEGLRLGPAQPKLYGRGIGVLDPGGVAVELLRIPGAHRGLVIFGHRGQALAGRNGGLVEQPGLFGRGQRRPGFGGVGFALCEQGEFGQEVRMLPLHGLLGKSRRAGRGQYKQGYQEARRLHR
ncbi:MAG: hypothetical protein CVU79_07285 [Elusimicrobia bacterium HGW-Elusimicrobia-3]|nr:MAG: hypothetical protein CVU79_07285 [Elusimicrobia bacterium HGW-Elusimicrobia-3]